MKDKEGVKYERRMKDKGGERWKRIKDERVKDEKRG
jgi:hypothetical protein